MALFGRVKGETDLLGYARDYGRNPIGLRHPFNEVDGVILCRISYLKLEQVAKERPEKSIALESLGPELEEACRGQWLDPYQRKDLALLKVLARSPRFKKLKLTGFSASSSLKKTEQFAACTILVGSRTAFVSFRGTDATLNGWREDFDLGCLGSIPSHVDALRYVKRAMARFPSRRFVLGGHSKGGNLASYCAMRLSPSRLRKRIQRVYLIDAPGFRKDVLLQGKADDLSDKVVNLAPTQSVVGMIFDSPFPAVPVRSRGLMMFQHDVYLWAVAEDAFAPSSFDPVCYAIKRWSIAVFEGLDIPSVELTLDTVFAFLKRQFGEDVSIVFAHPWRSLFLFASGMRRLQGKPKEIVDRTGKMFASFYRSAIEASEKTLRPAVVKKR